MPSQTRDPKDHSQADCTLRSNQFGPYFGPQVHHTQWAHSINLRYSIACWTAEPSRLDHPSHSWQPCHALPHALPHASLSCHPASKTELPPLLKHSKQERSQIIQSYDCCKVRRKERLKPPKSFSETSSNCQPCSSGKACAKEIQHCHWGVSACSWPRQSPWISYFSQESPFLITYS